jgi:phospholipid-binding lipoprotein MlaA
MTLSSASEVRGLLRRWAGLALLPVMLLPGCASLPGEGKTRIDPWETYNRQVFEVNEVIDRVALKPVAEAYRAVLPRLVRTGVANFFNNVADVWTSANLMLQVKPRQSLEMGMRAVVNTTFGLGGVMDFAEEVGLERFTVEDFGQTLGYWGLRSGPYLVLPLLGPSTLRDTAGLALDFKDSGASLVWYRARERNIATAVQLVNARVQLLGAGQFLDEIALDKYVLLRDAYLARRKSLIYDGEPPDDDSAPAPFNNLIKKDGQ